MARVLIITSERLGAQTAGPGLRAAGLATGLAAHGHEAILFAAAGSTAPATIALAPTGDLSAAVRSVDTVIIPASLLHRYPEALAATRLCVDFAGPYPLEARASGLPPREVLAAERSAAAAMAQADVVLCSQPRQIAYARGLLLAHEPNAVLAADRFIVVPFGNPAGAGPFESRPFDGGLRLVWPGGLWDWLDPIVLLDALGGAPAGTTVEFWGIQSPDPSAPRMQLSERVRQGVAARGFDNIVRLVDWVPADEFDRRLATFDLAVTFDDAGEEPRHAFRTRLLHALGVGVPTLATAGEYVADLAQAREAGWTVPPGDAAAIAELLHALATDPLRIARARNAARNLADEFSYPELVAPLAAWVAAASVPLTPRDARIPMRARLRRVLGQHRH